MCWVDWVLVFLDGPALAGIPRVWFPSGKQTKTFQEELFIAYTAIILLLIKLDVTFIFDGFTLKSPPHIPNIPSPYKMLT